MKQTELNWQAGTSRDEAYREAIAEAGLPRSAMAVALWMDRIGQLGTSADGQRCRITRLPPQRQLAQRAGTSLAGVSRGLRYLEAAGLLCRMAAHFAVLNLSGICERAEARAAAMEADEIRFQTTECFSAFQRVSLPPDPEKEIYKDPDTEPENRGEGCGEGAAAGSRQPAAGSGPAAPANIADGLARLNGTAAWRDLQNGDFRDASGGFAWPGAKLAACLVAAHRLGMVAGDRDGRLLFVASAHDCMKHAKTPAAALAWRVAARRLWMATTKSAEWAKRFLNREVRERENPSCLSVGSGDAG